MSNHKSDEGKGTNPTAPAEPRTPAEQITRRVRLDQLDRGELKYFLRDVKYLQEDSGTP